MKNKLIKLIALVLALCLMPTMGLAAQDYTVAEKLLRIMEDPEHRAFLGENAKKKFAEINDAPKYKQAIWDCYKR